MAELMMVGYFFAVVFGLGGVREYNKLPEDKKAEIRASGPRLISPDDIKKYLAE